MLQSDSHKRSDQKQASQQQGIKQGGKKDGGNQTDFNLQTPEIENPKGGGDIENIDEKFQVNPNNGTFSLSILLPYSDGRSGFIPILKLAFNSGSGNSSYEIGRQFGMSSIKRKTEKQLSRYIVRDKFKLTLIKNLI